MSNKTTRKPPIVIGSQDHERLGLLAASASERFEAVSAELMAELDRARVMPQAKLAAGIVRMGSTVTFRTGEDAPKTVTLVFPAKADIEKGRISILTPIGTALIGLSEGQSIGWIDRQGRRHELTVETVSQQAVEDEVGASA